MVRGKPNYDSMLHNYNYAKIDTTELLHQVKTVQLPLLNQHVQEYAESEVLL